MAISTISVAQAVTYPGAILQVVQGTTGTQTSTTSTSYVATSLNASITPKSSTNKVLVMFSSQVYTSVTSKYTYYAIYRNAVKVAEQNSAYSDSAGIATYIGLNYLDSPATTSSTTYTIYLRSDTGNTVYFNTAQLNATIQLLEVAA